jgi:hypothetical protein
VVADVAVVAGERHLAAVEEVVETARVGFVPKAEQDSRWHVGRAEAAAEQRQRGNADAAADEDRAGGIGGKLLRSGERVAERAVYPNPLPRDQPAEAVGPRADPLDQEVEADPLVDRIGIGHREGAWQERSSPPLLPMALRREHVELPRLGLGTISIQ